MVKTQTPRHPRGDVNPHISAWEVWRSLPWHLAQIPMFILCFIHYIGSLSLEGCYKSVHIRFSFSSRSFLKEIIKEREKLQGVKSNVSIISVKSLTEVNIFNIWFSSIHMARYYLKWNVSTLTRFVLDKSVLAIAHLIIFQVRDYLLQHFSGFWG